MCASTTAIEGGSQVSVDVQVPDVPDEVLAYLQEQHTLTLATASKDCALRASTFLYVNEGPRLYFWTRLSSTSARHIAERPEVAFAIDEYASDLRQTRGLHGLGRCAPVVGAEIARVADLFGQRFPDLSPGSTVSIAFFSIVPSELEFIDNRESGSVAPEGAFGAEFHSKQL
jgi:uncharacterized protein YhbP (UPF0306 family)